jgi:hypothetical protein
MAPHKLNLHFGAAEGDLEGASTVSYMLTK